MRVVGLPRAFCYLSRHKPIVLSPKAQERLRWLRCFEALRVQGLSSSQASRTLLIPRSTLYRWQKRLKSKRKGQGAGREEPETQVPPAAHLERRVGPGGAGPAGKVPSLGKR